MPMHATDNPHLACHGRTAGQAYRTTNLLANGKLALAVIVRRQEGLRLP